MSTTPLVREEVPRRVRDQARDVVVLMVFSAVVSVGFTLTMLLMAQWGR